MEDFSEEVRLFDLGDRQELIVTQRAKRVYTCLSISEFVPHLTRNGDARKLRFEKGELVDKCKIQQR
ncbi:hypothetical protein [Haloarcula hispanica]|uniref:hypothetical protein n=1 Tax=Haloarcula hispanica TaxID=51589 RepID=UPI001F5CBF20|nr:hypothetical protein [Haloarcula hispanica]